MDLGVGWLDGATRQPQARPNWEGVPVYVIKADAALPFF